MDCLEKLGTEYCPNCAILASKMAELEIRERKLEKREAELDKELAFMNRSKIIL